MKHTLGYIIETDEDVALTYVETAYPPYYQPEWVRDVNEFDSIDDVDPNDVSTPELIRVQNGGGYTYYFKALRVPWNTVSFRISVLIDGVEGNSSFIYDGYETFVRARRVGSEIYTKIQKNKGKTERTSDIVISYRSDDSIQTRVRIIQEACDVSLKILSCEVDEGNTSTEYPVDSNTFEYELKTLTEKTDAVKQSLKITMDVRGIRNRFFVKSIKEYAEVGEIDNTYVYMDGKYYKKKQKYVDGDLVSYYSEAIVIDNMAYQLKTYDNAFHVEMQSNNVVVFSNYGRVFLDNNVFYLITLANYDDINTTCEIKLTYSID